ncbi:hypothetical protein JCM21714_3481 [Gracilibacillus boraciitolerans JCM 21714]|uniref:HTH cro/C1-type domain-containing protein n=1 Tax=Gracilibacillus boraciitolerans JCM 21714 TaxID=1298598 RepID=W4VNB3_9BACI|nr:hypothetical protein JCM21714_3481 [Gracilibacillus boraciitolerans JCM 21714]
MISLRRGKFFVELAKHKGFNLKQLSKETDLPYSTLQSMIKRDFYNASINKMIDICNVIDIRVEDLYEKDLNEDYLKKLIQKDEPGTFVLENVLIEFIENDLSGLVTFLEDHSKFTSQLFHISNNILEEDKKMLLIYLEQALKLTRKIKYNR